ncbi:hypothetical protein C8Q70DRAFT_601255 [Cubamyces menziesii]|nr:hypothetical protein C8Q70DRAFT_601255 [Cubamyces menziesii]
MMSKVLITIVAKAQELSTVWKHHSKYRLDIACPAKSSIHCEAPFRRTLMAMLQLSLSQPPTTSMGAFIAFIQSATSSPSKIVLHSRLSGDTGGFDGSTTDAARQAICRKLGCAQQPHFAALWLHLLPSRHAG